MIDNMKRIWAWLCGLFVFLTIALLVLFCLPSSIQTQLPTTQLYSLVASWILAAAVILKKTFFPEEVAA